MRTDRRGLFLVVGLGLFGCAPDERTVEAPETTVTAPAPRPPMSPDTAVKRLGVEEEIISAPADEQRLWSLLLPHEPALARCLADDLEREPSLAGSASLSLAIDERGARVTLDRESTLPALPSIECVQRELEGIGPGARGVGLVGRYQLRLTGQYRPVSTPRPAATELMVDSLAKPGAVVAERAAIGDTLSKVAGRCIREGDTPAWIVGELRTDQKLEIARGRKPPSAAERCIARAIAEAKWPSVREPLAVSALYAAAPETKASQSKPANEPESQVGVLVGSADGVGGLGLGGASGIGLGTLGTIGHGQRSGQGPTGQGRLGGEHRSTPPQIKMGGTSVAGRLPPEVIQRIVRQSFGRFRLCYEKGLAKDPSLAGTMRVSFTIGRNGKVTEAKDSGTLKDAAVAACVVKAFRGLTFPEPEGGVVKVTYPVAFSPGGDADGAPSPPEPPRPATARAFTVGGKTVSELTSEGLAAALEKVHMEARFPGRPASRPNDPLVVFVKRENGKTVLLHRMAEGSPEAKTAMAVPEPFQTSGGAVLAARSDWMGAAVATLSEIGD